MKRYVKLSEISEIERGTEPGRDTYCSSTEGIRFLRVGDITGKGYEEIYTNSKNVVLVEEVDILMTFDGTPGFVNRGLKGAISSGVRRLTPKDKNILDRNYLFYVLQTEGVRKTVLKYSSGQTIIHASKSILHIEIPLLPLSEQKRIVEILEKADNLRKKRQEADESFKNMFSSLFLKLFGNPENNPKKWPIVTFKEVTNAIFKGVFDLKAASYQTSGVPFLRIANIQNYTIDLSGAVYISEEAHEKEKKSELLPGDIIFSKVGTIDRIAIIPAWINKCNISQNNVGARLKRDVVVPEYALGYLTSGFTINKIKQSSKRVLQDKLVLFDLRKLPFMLPPILEQRKFSDLVQKLEKIKEKQQETKQGLDDVFNALKQKIFEK